MKISSFIFSAKRPLLPAFVFFLSSSLMAQHEIKKTMPPFRILLTNMKYLKVADLDKNTAKMLVYFDPTCDHCKTFTTELLKQETSLAKTQIIMISYAPMAQMKKFETDYNIGRYKNIRIGTEGFTFTVQKYFNIQRFPFTALYDKKGIMIASYREAPGMQDLLLKMKKT